MPDQGKFLVVLGDSCGDDSPNRRVGVARGRNRNQFQVRNLRRVDEFGFLALFELANVCLEEKGPMANGIILLAQLVVRHKHVVVGRDAVEL